MRDYEAPNTKLKIVLAAGELFAEHGFDGVTTRSIARKAEITLGSLHYHFKSKNELYLETIQYIADKKEHKEIDDYLAEDPDILNRPQDISNMICRNIKDHFYHAMVQSNPEWGPKLIHREAIMPSAGWRIFHEKLLKPFHENYFKIFRHLNSQATDNEAHFWVFIVQSQMAMHCLFKHATAEIVGPENVTEDFYAEMAYRTAQTMTSYLGLPDPIIK
ncbi:MAG: CerR family C-terminal domain-containing protein [Phycisphaerae bacterium]|nr:CerR family C-terminal domain-containing protein [Phycisphaerae bacterium]